MATGHHIAGAQGIWRLNRYQALQHTGRRRTPKGNETTKTSGRQNPTQFLPKLANIPPKVIANISFNDDEEGSRTSPNTGTSRSGESQLHRPPVSTGALDGEVEDGQEKLIPR